GVTVPYEQVDMVELRDGRVTRVQTVQASELKDFRIEWNRNEPIVFSRTPTFKGCPLNWPAKIDPLMPGWSAPEDDALGAFRWTTARTARVALPVTCKG